MEPQKFPACTRSEPELQCIYEGWDSRLRSVEETIPAIVEKPATSPLFEPNRNAMQKPVEGLPVLALFSTKKQEGKGAKKTIAAYHANVRSMFQSLHKGL